MLLLGVLFIFSSLGCLNAVNLTPPVWPDQFKAIMFQNRTDHLALTTLYYGEHSLVAINLSRGDLALRQTNDGCMRLDQLQDPPKKSFLLSNSLCSKMHAASCL
jgi:hypothetical protein